MGSFDHTTHTQQASPKRFVHCALAATQKDPQSAQVYRVEPGGGERCVDIDTVLKRPGNYVLRSLEGETDDGRPIWVDVATTAVSSEDDEAHGTLSPRTAAARGEAMKDEGWNLLVGELRTEIKELKAEIKELKAEAKASGGSAETLKESLAEAHAELEMGAGRWIGLAEKFGPVILGAIQGTAFRVELVRRLNLSSIPADKRTELIELLNADEMKGPSPVAIDVASDDEKKGKGG